MTIRYLSQVRQELAMRLLARVYAGGNTPSKVRSSAVERLMLGWTFADAVVVVVELYEEEVHGQVALIGHSVKPYSSDTNNYS